MRKTFSNFLALAVSMLVASAASAGPLPWLPMNESQAARFAEQTAGDANRLEPRLATAGPCKGKWLLPRRVMDDPAYVARRDAFLMLGEVVCDPEVAFPAPPEE